MLSGHTCYDGEMTLFSFTLHLLRQQRMIYSKHRRRKPRSLLAVTKTSWNHQTGPLAGHTAGGNPWPALAAFPSAPCPGLTGRSQLRTCWVLGRRQGSNPSPEAPGAEGAPGSVTSTDVCLRGPGARAGTQEHLLQESRWERQPRLGRARPQRSLFRRGPGGDGSGWRTPPSPSPSRMTPASVCLTRQGGGD